MSLSRYLSTLRIDANAENTLATLECGTLKIVAFELLQLHIDKTMYPNAVDADYEQIILDYPTIYDLDDCNYFYKLSATDLFELGCAIIKAYF